jgi:hypothetical protein
MVYRVIPERPARIVKLLPLALCSVAIITNPCGARERSCDSVAFTAYLLGTENLRPKSARFQALKRKILAIQSLEELPELEWRQFTHLRRLPRRDYGGEQNRGIWRARLGRGDVAIKISTAPVELTLNHAKIQILLNKLGWGPEFRGWVRRAGDVGPVTSFVEGAHFDEMTELDDLPPRFPSGSRPPTKSSA